MSCFGPHSEVPVKVWYFVRFSPSRVTAAWKKASRVGDAAIAW